MPATSSIFAGNLNETGLDKYVLMYENFEIDDIVGSVYISADCANLSQKIRFR